MSKKQKLVNGAAQQDYDIPEWCLTPDKNGVTPWLHIVVGCSAGTIDTPLENPQAYAKAVCSRARALAYLMDDYGTP